MPYLMTLPQKDSWRIVRDEDDLQAAAADFTGLTGDELQDVLDGNTDRASEPAVTDDPPLEDLEEEAWIAWMATCLMTGQWTNGRVRVRLRQIPGDRSPLSGDAPWPGGQAQVYAVHGDHEPAWVTVTSWGHLRRLVDTAASEESSAFTYHTRHDLPEAERLKVLRQLQREVQEAHQQLTLAQRLRTHELFLLKALRVPMETLSAETGMDDPEIRYLHVQREWGEWGPSETYGSAAELKMFTTYLGFTDREMARYLGVDERTCRRWLTGAAAVPVRICLKVLALESWTTRVVDELIDELRASDDPVALLYRTDEELHADRPDTAPLPAGWWRAVCARASREVDDVDIAYWS